MDWQKNLCKRKIIWGKLIFFCLQKLISLFQLLLVTAVTRSNLLTKNCLSGVHWSAANLINDNLSFNNQSLCLNNHSKCLHGDRFDFDFWEKKIGCERLCFGRHSNRTKVIAPFRSCFASIKAWKDFRRQKTKKLQFEGMLRILRWGGEK